MSKKKLIMKTTGLFRLKKIDLLSIFIKSESDPTDSRATKTETMSLTRNPKSHASAAKTLESCPPDDADGK